MKFHYHIQFLFEIHDIVQQYNFLDIVTFYNTIHNPPLVVDVYYYYY